MSKVDCNIGLCGEFRLTVLENKTVVHDTGWCKNTILAGGLEYLASDTLLNCMKYLDFGTSILNPGDYDLTGAITPCGNIELTDINSNNTQYFPLNKSVQVYYSTFSSLPITFQPEIINEYCIKTINGTGFSRAILPAPVIVDIGQSVNFEYRVSVDFFNEHKTNVEFITQDGTSFYIPVTSKVFNMPNFDTDLSRAGRLADVYPMVLLQNKEEIPS